MQQQNLQRCEAPDRFEIGDARHLFARAFRALGRGATHRSGIGQAAATPKHTFSSNTGIVLCLFASAGAADTGMAMQSTFSRAARTASGTRARPPIGRQPLRNLKALGPFWRDFRGEMACAAKSRPPLGTKCWSRAGSGWKDQSRNLEISGFAASRRPGMPSFSIARLQEFIIAS